MPFLQKREQRPRSDGDRQRRTGGTHTTTTTTHKKEFWAKLLRRVLPAVVAVVVVLAGFVPLSPLLVNVLSAEDKKKTKAEYTSKQKTAHRHRYFDVQQDLCRARVFGLRETKNWPQLLACGVKSERKSERQNHLYISSFPMGEPNSHRQVDGAKARIRRAACS